MRRRLGHSIGYFVELLNVVARRIFSFSSYIYLKSTKCHSIVARPMKKCFKQLQICTLGSHLKRRTWFLSFFSGNGSRSSSLQQWWQMRRNSSSRTVSTGKTFTEQVRWETRSCRWSAKRASSAWTETPAYASSAWGLCSRSFKCPTNYYN